MSLLANKQITKGWHFDSTSRKWVYGVYNSSGAVKKVFDEDGALYQEDTKLTLTAAQLNGTSTPLTSPVLTTPQINDTTADHQYVFAVNELAADRTVTLPLLTGNDEFVFKDHAVTMTNKTLTAPVMTQPSITCAFGTHDYSAAHADWTLSAAELLKMIHKPTNADAGVNAIIADTAGMPYVFVNGTGQALTVKTAAGTGVTITNGKTAIVMSDGTNVIALATESA